MTLYQLKDNYRAVLQMMEEDDIDQEAVLTTLEAISDEVEVKAENYAVIIAELKAEAEKIKTEEERLAKRRKALESNIDYLKWNLQSAMVLTGKTKFKTEHYAFSIQKNGGKIPVIVDDGEALPEEFKIYSWKVDNDKLRDYLEKNGKQEYAHMGIRGESIRIR